MDDVIDGIGTAVGYLERSPRQGRIVEDDRLSHMQQAGLRQIIHGNYRILYMVFEEDQTVEIQSIRHTSRDY